MKLIESSMRRQLLEVRLTSFHNLNATIEHQTLNDELAFVQFLIVLIYSLIDHNNFHLGSQVDTHLHWITISSQSHVARRLSLFNNYSIMTRRLYNSIANIVVSCSQICQWSHLPWNSWCQVLLNTHSLDFHLQWYWPFMPFLDWLALYYFGLMFIEIIYLCIFTWLDNLGQHV